MCGDPSRWRYRLWVGRWVFTPENRVRISVALCQPLKENGRSVHAYRERGGVDRVYVVHYCTHSTTAVRRPVKATVEGSNPSEYAWGHSLIG